MKRFLVLGLIIMLFTMGVGCNSQEKTHTNSSNVSAQNIKKSNVNNESKEDSETVEESKETMAIYKDVSSDEAKELIDSSNELVVLDVRTKREYNEGHLENAINISHEEVEKRLSEIEKYKNTPILLYCRTGRRSGIVLDILKKNEFNKVYHMHEGISEWPYEVIK